MRKWSSPPATIWACVIQERFHSLPFSSALWMYTFCGELFSATMVNVLPVPGLRMAARFTSGLPMMYTPVAALTG